MRSSTDRVAYVFVFVFVSTFRSTLSLGTDGMKINGWNSGIPRGCRTKERDGDAGGVEIATLRAHTELHSMLPRLVLRTCLVLLCLALSCFVLPGHALPGAELWTWTVRRLEGTIIVL